MSIPSLEGRYKLAKAKKIIAGPSNHQRDGAIEYTTTRGDTVKRRQRQLQIADFRLQISLYKIRNLKLPHYAPCALRFAAKEVSHDRWDEWSHSKKK
jgi:hypothetical protein